MSEYTPNLNAAISQFKDFGLSLDVAIPDNPTLDGSGFSRCPLVGKPRANTDGAYKLHTDGRPAGIVWNHSTGIQETWKYDDPDYVLIQLTPEQREQQAKEQRQNKELREKELAETKAAAAEKANYLWNKSKPLPDKQSHQYLVRKGVKGVYGLRVNYYNSETSLVVPLGKNGKLTAIQFIKPDKPADGTADKKIIGDKVGSYFRLNKMDRPKIIALAEGLATIASIHQAPYIQKIGAMCVMAVDAGNLEAVAVIMREQNPLAAIIVFGDKGDKDDKGEKAAWAAAKLVNGYCVLPPITKGDFNDYLTGGAVTASLEDLILMAGFDADNVPFEPVEINQQAVNAPTIDSELVLPITQTTHNATLDDTKHYCTADFLSAVNDDHLLKQLALSIADATSLPIHTVFLMGLGVFASVACRQWCVSYQYGGTLPIGVYVVAEQPSGTAKSRTLNAFQQPFNEAEKSTKERAKKELAKVITDINAIEKADRNGDFYDSLVLKKSVLESVLAAKLFTTNSTPEALEQSLNHSHGFFSAASSEQGLFNTMLGSCYGADRVSNNDLLLNGYDGGYIGSMRVGRDGYHGAVVGGAVMFAQQGGIETLLKASNGTGLAERFLMIAEPHNLGKRDYTKPSMIDRDLTARYGAICRDFAEFVLMKPLDYDALPNLIICADGWQLINVFRNSINRHLLDGGRYSHVALRGAAAKVDMQIMKIASVLHLLDNGTHESNIDIKHVKSAIAIAHAMIESNLKLCTDKGIIGARAEYTAILSLFEHSNKPRIERNIIQSKSSNNPFKNFTGNKSQLIKQTLTDMVSDGLLKETYTPDGARMYSMAQ